MPVVFIPFEEMLPDSGHMLQELGVHAAANALPRFSGYSPGPKWRMVRTDLPSFRHESDPPTSPPTSEMSDYRNWINGCYVFIRPDTSQDLLFFCFGNQIYRWNPKTKFFNYFPYNHTPPPTYAIGTNDVEDLTRIDTAHGNIDWPYQMLTQSTTWYPTNLSHSRQGWQMTQYGNSVIASNFYEAIQWHTITGSSPFSQLITRSAAVGAAGEVCEPYTVAGVKYMSASPRARYVSTIKNHLILGDIDMTVRYYSSSATPTPMTEYSGGQYGTEGAPNTYTSALSSIAYPNMVWWSKTDDPQRFGDPTWTPAETGSDYQIFGDELGAVTGMAGGDECLIFRERGMLLMSGPPFVFNTISREVGCRFPNSICQYDEDVYFWSDRGPAVVRKKRQIEFLADGRIGEFVSKIETISNYYQYDTSISYADYLEPTTDCTWAAINCLLPGIRISTSDYTGGTEASGEPVDAKVIGNEFNPASISAAVDSKEGIVFFCVSYPRRRWDNTAHPGDAGLLTHLGVVPQFLIAYDIKANRFSWLPNFDMGEDLEDGTGTHWWSMMAISQLASTRDRYFYRGYYRQPGNAIFALAQVQNWNVKSTAPEYGGEAPLVVQPLERFFAPIQLSYPLGDESEVVYDYFTSESGDGRKIQTSGLGTVIETAFSRLSDEGVTRITAIRPVVSLVGESPVTSTSTYGKNSINAKVSVVSTSYVPTGPLWLTKDLVAPSGISNPGTWYSSPNDHGWIKIPDSVFSSYHAIRLCVEDREAGEASGFGRRNISAIHGIEIEFETAGVRGAPVR